MLENWLQAAKLKEEDGSSWQLEKKITIFKKKFPNLKNTKIALIGTGKEVNKIRADLYKMAFPFSRLAITDIGNLRKPTEAFLLPVLKELLQNGTLPIIISHQEVPFTAQFKAYQNRNQLLNVGIIDERIPWTSDHSDYLSIIKRSKAPRINHLGIIGYQTHFVPSDTLKLFRKRHYDCVRLGFAKSDLEQIEPIIRDMDTLYFNLAALKRSEAPGTWKNSPSGFSSEEACQLSRYAGMSDRLTSIGFYGYQFLNDQSDQTAQLVAQMIWYLLEGIYSRKRDFPASVDGMVEYIVAFKQYNYEATFWKSTKSGRWWIQVTAKSKGKSQNQLIPCAYEDYQMACRDELSERIIAIFERFS